MVERYAKRRELVYKGLNSRKPGPCIMHACSHDSHMAMLLVTARVLMENLSSLTGRIKFVFQPNEFSSEVPGVCKC